MSAMTSSPLPVLTPSDLGTLDLIHGHDTFGLLLSAISLLEEAKGRCDRVNTQAVERGSDYQIQVSDLMVAIGAIQEVAATL